MKVDYSIITSLLNTDWYKITMGQVVFHEFPNAVVEWEFINRGKTQFPEGFGNELENQVNLLSELALTFYESVWLNNQPVIRPTYVEWLSGFRLDPNEVIISQDGPNLSIKIKGPWYRVIYWEVILMALISELYFLLTNAEMGEDTYSRMEEKGLALETAGCEWSDFGTRRRYSHTVQDRLVNIMRRYRGFQGTSNPHFAMKYGVPVIGTSAHEAQMAMSALVGVRHSNPFWLDTWIEFYKGMLGIALTDTVTTNVFLRDFNAVRARVFDGVRHDSSDPYIWGDRMLTHYRGLRIDPITKRFVFSDNLNVSKYIAIHNYFKPFCRPQAGIGTHFTNDCGPHIKPLNIVIKMTRADFGDGFKDVVKLSDEPGKHTGNSDAIVQAKRELGIEL